jgi:hypothetical protein
MLAHMATPPLLSGKVAQKSGSQSKLLFFINRPSRSDVPSAGAPLGAAFDPIIFTVKRSLTRAVLFEGDCSMDSASR